MAFDALRTAVIDGDAAGAEREVRAALAGQTAAQALLSEALIPAMHEVGRQFETGECFVPEMLAAARAMKAAMEILRPLLIGEGRQAKHTIAIGTVKGDIHDIGKNLVATMLEGSGFRVVDLGVDVPFEKFVEAARGEAQLLGLSAMLTTTMPNMGRVIAALTDAGVRERVKVLVGGAPLSQQYADQIGADGYAPDAGAAVRKALELVGEAS
jgi:5-methyltetrahydrofolate--homocysteine methyltransferase